MQALSPALNIGTTLAIFSWVGTMPVLSDKLKMWKSGLINEDNVCLIKLVETPLWSGVFLLVRSNVASKISFFVKFLSLNLKVFGFCSNNSTGDLFDGTIFSTVLAAILAK